MVDAVINAGGTYELGYDNSLRTIDDEGAGICHERKVAHEDLMLIDLVLVLVDETYLDLQWRRIRGVTLLALFDRIFLLIFAELVIHELEAQMPRKILDR